MSLRERLKADFENLEVSRAREIRSAPDVSEGLRRLLPAEPHWEAVAASRIGEPVDIDPSLRGRGAIVRFPDEDDNLRPDHDIRFYVTLTGGAAEFFVLDGCPDCRTLVVLGEAVASAHDVGERLATPRPRGHACSSART